jgi:thiamine-monophosphate kinase
MKLSEIGEEKLIAKLLKTHKIPASAEYLPVGAGDDAAVISSGSACSYTIVATDMLSEGIDYRDDIITTYYLGWKSAAVNISDIAAMGGSPTWTLVSLGFKQDTEFDYLEAFYTGLTDCCSKYGSVIIGGDMNSVINENTISITQMGSIEPKLLIRRSGAEPGDLLFVTGYIGQSRAGLELLFKNGLQSVQSKYETLMKAHIMPIPRVYEANILAKTKMVKAMMDVSDGLGSDLPKLCSASGVGASVYAESICLSEDLKRAAQELKLNPLEIAISGGEDFELLFAAAPGDAASIIDIFSSSTDTPLHVIGEFTENGLSIIHSDGSKGNLVSGWDHFHNKNS